ncbi:MAG: hypothetical protein ACI9OU_000875 [Candidatus Promineifilaceae bacterium]|jgi:uncharacterized protein YbbC (DUF1343 family)
MMPVAADVQPGIHALLTTHTDWLDGKRVGLVSHMAAVDTLGRSTAQRLHAQQECTLVNLMGPEHGYFGNATAGEHVQNRQHPTLNIPVHSLYGKTRKPSPDMLADIDTIVVDLQDLGVRCYTYVSTLRLVLECAAEFGKTVIVADRPIPFPNTIDGPMLNPDLASFVASMPMPFVYGMTPGEAARWIVDTLALDVTLHVAPMQGYARNPNRACMPVPWIPPSPGIVSWESATCYPSTVFGEALPAIDHGRCTGLPFQLIGAPWMDGIAISAALEERNPAGTQWHPHPYYLMAGDNKGKLVSGVRFVVTDTNSFRPAETCVAILDVLRDLHGRDTTWHDKNARPAFFDKLFGNTELRESLVDGRPPAEITSSWVAPMADFAEQRERALLYPQPTS